jgi:hypothetical protein
VEAAAGESFVNTYMASDSTSCTESLDGTAPSTPSTHTEYELYIPAPEDALREEAYSWHITTRNFFAYIMSKPLVGAKLGKTFIDLLERIQLFCPNKTSNSQDFLKYAQQQGYLKFVNRPDYALASLNFAEKFKLRDLWIDAFAHCVGMNDQLDLSPEFSDVSKVTKALITRSYLEMDLHLGRVTKALRNFLEDELASTHLGLPTPARNHLERFRSFLHSYYVNKFGYWPPETGHIMDKGLLRSMHQEFQILYDYLVDGDSSPDSTSRLPTGGICVVQNVDAFNSRHKYEPLPHPSPLLPDYQSLEYRTSSQKGLRSLRLTSKSSKVDQSVSARAALTAATNKISSSSALVRNYIYFESKLTFRPEEKLSVGDARKVRWIAIYSILQMLTNAIRAPKEVIGADVVPYHLCLLTTGMPPWNEDIKTTTSELSQARPIKIDRETSDESTFTIHPDCEDNDYFSHKTMPNRSDSLASLRPQPLRINTTSSVNRNSSIRSLHKSLTSNFSFPTRRTSFRSSVSSNNAQSNPAEQTAESPVNKRFSGYSFAISEEETLDYLNPQQPERTLAAPSYHLPEARTPTLDVFMLDHVVSQEAPSTPSSFASSIMSPASASSNMWDSSPQSVSSDDMDAPSWYDRHSSSAGVHNMDHDSVCGDSNRKSSSSSSCSCSGTSSPASDLSTLTASSAAAATAKMFSSHAGLALQYQNQQGAAQMPAWWGVAGDRASPRSSASSFAKQAGQSFGVSVTEDVPEDGVMAFRTYSHEFVVERGVESTVDIFDAMRMLN